MPQRGGSPKQTAHDSVDFHSLGGTSNGLAVIFLKPVDLTEASRKLDAGGRASIMMGSESAKKGLITCARQAAHTFLSQLMFRGYSLFEARDRPE